MDGPLKLGDRVVISKFGKECYPNSPHDPYDFEGEVILIDKEGWGVRWDNGQVNFYVKDTLELVYIQLEND